MGPREQDIHREADCIADMMNHGAVGQAADRLRQDMYADPRNFLHLVKEVQQREYNDGCSPDLRVDPVGYRNGSQMLDVHIVGQTRDYYGRPQMQNIEVGRLQVCNDQGPYDPGYPVPGQGRVPPYYPNDGRYPGNGGYGYPNDRGYPYPSGGYPNDRNYPYPSGGYPGDSGYPCPPNTRNYPYPSGYPGGYPYPGGRSNGGDVAAGVAIGVIGGVILDQVLNNNHRRRW